MINYERILTEGALEGKLTGIIKLHEDEQIDDKKFVELVKRSYTEYLEDMKSVTTQYL
jgi:hypothetical protein